MAQCFGLFVIDDIGSGNTIFIIKKPHYKKSLKLFQMATQQAYPKNVRMLASFLFVSIILTLYLGYIDEGNYSFDGLFKGENLPALFMYVAIFCGLQFFIAKVVLRRYRGQYPIVLSIVLFASFLFALGMLA
jgi:hypothetical protein